MEMRKRGLKRIFLNLGRKVSSLLILSASTSLTSIISFCLSSDKFIYGTKIAGPNNFLASNSS